MGTYNIIIFNKYNNNNILFSDKKVKFAKANYKLRNVQTLFTHQSEKLKTKNVNVFSEGIKS